MSEHEGHVESYAAYQDGDGKPRLVPSSVLFFDLLGTREMATGPDAEKELARLGPALDEAIKQSQIDHEWSRKISTWFTDNAVVAQPLQASHHRESVIGGLEIVAADLMVHCWRRGFLGRGAITYGEHYMSERFVFGPALVQAVNLEKSTRWPRVTLGTSAVEAEREHSTFYGQALQSTQSRCLTTDESGVVFVDHLGISISNSDGHIPHLLLKELREVTTDKLASLPENSEPWLKWRWAAEYHNYAIASHLTESEPYLVSIPEVRHHFSDFLDPTPATEPGSPWYIMDRVDRSQIGELGFDSLVPQSPGVYAVYRQGFCQYVGATGNLHTRIVRNHLGRSFRMRDSALRRNIMELLGFASAQAVKDGTYLPTKEQVDQVLEWLLDCEIAWIECESKDEALSRERDLKDQEPPPLTKR